MLAGPLLLSRFMAVYSLRGLQARRKTPQGVCAGDLLVAGITLTNTRRQRGKLGRGRRGANPPRRRRARGKRRGEAAGNRRSSSPICPPGQTRKGSYRGRLAQRGPLSTGTAAAEHALPLRLVLPHGDRGADRVADRFSPLGAAHPRLDPTAPASRLPARSGGSSGPAPTATSTAFAPGAAATAAAGSMGGPPPGPENSWCSSSSSRGTATWRCCWTCGSPTAPEAGAPGERRVGRQFRRHRGRRSVPQGRQQRLSGHLRRPARGAAAARRRRPCCKT